MIPLLSGWLTINVVSYFVAVVFGFWIFSHSKSNVVSAALILLVFFGVMIENWILLVGTGILLTFMFGLPKPMLLKGRALSPKDIMGKQKDAMAAAEDYQAEAEGMQILNYAYKGHITDI